MQKLRRLQGDEVHIVGISGDQPRKLGRISQGGGGGGGTRDHNALINRDMEDQHPINAITRLDGELEVRPSQSLTNMDIQLILNS